MDKINAVCIAAAFAGFSIAAVSFTYKPAPVAPVEAPHVSQPVFKEAQQLKSDLPGVPSPVTRGTARQEKVVNSLCHTFGDIALGAQHNRRKGVTRNAAEQEILSVSRSMPSNGPQADSVMSMLFTRILDVIYEGNYQFTPEQLVNFTYQTCDLNMHNSGLYLSF